MTLGLLSKSQMFPLKRCIPGGTQALNSLGCANKASSGGLEKKGQCVLKHSMMMINLRS